MGDSDPDCGKIVTMWGISGFWLEPNPNAAGTPSTRFWEPLELESVQNSFYLFPFFLSVLYLLLLFPIFFIFFKFLGTVKQESVRTFAGTFTVVDQREQLWISCEPPAAATLAAP